jgi:hypothetical protein
MDDRFAIALAYNRIRRTPAPEHRAWQAAVDAYLARHPEVSEREAGLAASRLIADASKTIPEVIWDGIRSQPVQPRRPDGRWG